MILFHPDFICGIIVQRRKGHLMAKFKVTSQGQLSEKIAFGHISDVFLKHRLYTWFKSTKP